MTATSRSEQATLIIEGRRRCAGCWEIKSVESFTRDARNKYGLNSLCTPCLAARRRRQPIAPAEVLRRRCRAHGITVEQFEALRAAQQDLCGVCQHPVDEFHIDHDHTCCSGKRSCGSCVRGLLCAGCNQGLGNFRDDPVALRAAADYLEARA